MTVRFLKGHAPYKQGDIAGFDDNQAKNLIEAGVCEAYGATKKPAQPKQEPKQDDPKEPETKQVDQAPHNKQVQEAPKKK